MIKYVTDKYGKDNVTQIITFGQLKPKAVIRDVGRALDMPYNDVDRIAKLVPNELDITIESAIEKEPRLKKLIQDDARVAALIVAAKALEGLPRVMPLLTPPVSSYRISRLSSISLCTRVPRKK